MLFYCIYLVLDAPSLHMLLLLSMMYSTDQVGVVYSVNEIHQLWLLISDV